MTEVRDNGKDYPSLEHIVFEGLSKEEIEKSERINIRKVPELVRSSLLFLRNEDKNLYSLSQVTRFVTKTGANKLQKLIPAKQVHANIKQAYLQGDTLKRQKLCSTLHYEFGFRLGLPFPGLTCYVLRWTGGVIVDLSQDVGLPASTITTLVLISGLGCSESWIPKDYRDSFIQETSRFIEWIEERLRFL